MCRLGASQKVADVLVSRGKLIQAMRYLREHSQVMIPAKTLLDAARYIYVRECMYVYIHV